MYTDILLIICILLFSMIGFIRGSVHQLLSLATLVALVFFSYPMAVWLKAETSWEWLHYSPVFMIWGISCLFIIGLSIVVYSLFSHFTKASVLRPIDRVLGAGLGLVRGALIVSLFALSAQFLPDNFRSSYTELDTDLERSQIVQSSASILSWDFSASLRELRKIQERINSSLPAYEKGGPWDFEFGTDSN